jgi:acetyl esterase/lipase
VPEVIERIQNSSEAPMLVDPDLKVMEQMAMPDFGDIAVVRAWEQAMRDAAPPPPADAEAGLDISDRTIPGPAGAPDVPVRLYRPQGAPPIGALVYFHGGSTIMGGLETEHWACLRYAREAGVLVVSVDYRLAPENPFPAGVEDCYAAVVWTARSAGELGVDPGKIALGGSSAGGLFAAAVALMARDRPGPRPILQMLHYPALDDRMDSPSMNRFLTPPFLTRDVVGHMWRHYLGAPGASTSPYAVPARATDLSDVAAAYIEAGALDPLRDETVAYATRLWQADVAAELIVFPGAPHAYDVIPGAAVTERAFAGRAQALRRAFA